jgi:hypothetical protein
VRDPQAAADVKAAPLAPQPLAVQQMRAGEFGNGPGSLQVAGCVLVAASASALVASSAQHRVRTPAPQAHCTGRAAVPLALGALVGAAPPMRRTSGPSSCRHSLVRRSSCAPSTARTSTRHTGLMQLEAELQRFGATTDRLEAAVSRLSPEPSASSVSWTVV